MEKVRLWTRNFIALVFANGLLFAGFHMLLPTLPLYVSNLGATGSQVGLVTGIFGYAAICIRLFTDNFVNKLGKKKCLYLGLLFSIIATLGYMLLDQIGSIIVARIIHGFGFGLSTTFAAAIVADVIPQERRGEGIGYFGLGSTVAMALAPALGLMLLNDISSYALFGVSLLFTLCAIVAAMIDNTKVPHPVQAHDKVKTSIKNRIYESGTGTPAILTILFGAGYGGVNTFIALLAKEVGIEQAGLFFIVGTIFIFISRPFGGRLLDLKGAFPVVISGGILYIIGLFMILATQGLGLYLAASVFYGLGAGLLLPALLTWMLNQVAVERRSAASATFYNMLDIGTSTGILLLGTIGGIVGYSHMFEYVIILMVIFIVFSILQHIRGNCRA